MSRSTSQDSKATPGVGCKVCRHPRLKEIQKELVSGTPAYTIPGLFGNDFSRFTLNRHIKDCMQASYKTFREANRMKMVGDVDRRFQFLLDAAEEALGAAREILLVDGELNFNPRAWEINVVYEDYNDTNREGDPKLKTAPLDELLWRLAEQGFRPKRTTIRNEDARKGYREQIAQCESLIDRFAKLFGAYRQDRKNENNELDDIRDVIQKTALKLQTSYGYELERFLEDHGDRLRPDLREALIDEMRRLPRPEKVLELPAGDV